MLGQTIIYLGTRHLIGYRVLFTTAKLHRSGQYQKILKISALSGLALPYFLVLAIFLSLTVLISQELYLVRRHSAQHRQDFPLIVAEF